MTKMTKMTKNQSTFMRYFIEDNPCDAHCVNQIIQDNYCYLMIDDICEYQEMGIAETKEMVESLVEIDVLQVENIDMEMYKVTDKWLQEVQSSGQGNVPFEKLKLEKLKNLSED